MALWAEMVRSREPTVHTVIGFVDGVALHVQCNDSLDEQAAFYSGHVKDSMVNNVLALAD